MTVRTLIGGLYVDDLRYSNPTGNLGLINRIPDEAETDVHAASSVRLTIVSFVAANLAANARVWLTRGLSAAKTLVYAQDAGGFQAGYSGTATVQPSVASGFNDELVLVIQPGTAFSSLEDILVEVSAYATGFPDEFEDSYSFTVEDLTAPALESILWFTPRRCRVKFDEAVSTLVTPGGSQFSFFTQGNVEIISSSQIRIPGVTLSATWIGYWLSLHGSYSRNNAYRPVLAVNTSTQVVTVDITGNYSSLIVDDGQDRDASGVLVRRRELLCAVSPWKFTFAAGDEGSGELPNASARIQCAFLPAVKSVELPTADELPAGELPGQYLLMTLHDDISTGRLYSLICDGIDDLWGNPAVEASVDFQTPGFGSPARRMQLWQNGIIPATDREDDEAGAGDFRRITVVLQDLLNVLWYRTDQLEFLSDPDLCPDAWLDHLLYNLGNPFSFPLETTYMKRRVIAGLIGFYKRVGTVAGIRELLYRLLGIWFDIHPYVTADGWILEDPVLSILGFTTILGPSVAWNRNAYEVVSPVDLTADQLRIVIDVCQWADPINSHLARVLDPSTISSGGTTVTTNPWTLGTSALGFSSILGS